MSQGSNKIFASHKQYNLSRFKFHVFFCTKFHVLGFLLLQNLADSDNKYYKMWKQIFVIIYTVMGLSYTSIEIMSYIILYTYIANHNNNTAQGILDPMVFKMRNRSNAIRYQRYSIDQCFPTFFGSGHPY